MKNRYKEMFDELWNTPKDKFTWHAILKKYEEEVHTLDWYINRIGKRIHRINKTGCECEACTMVFNEGLIILDELHAQYLYDCQNEMGFRYY